MILLWGVQEYRDLSVRNATDSKQRQLAFAKRAQVGREAIHPTFVRAKCIALVNLQEQACFVLPPAKLAFSYFRPPANFLTLSDFALVGRL